MEEGLDAAEEEDFSQFHCPLDDLYLHERTHLHYQVTMEGLHIRVGSSPFCFTVEILYPTSHDQ
jgi:hypothetical protein